MSADSVICFMCKHPCWARMAVIDPDRSDLTWCSACWENYKGGRELQKRVLESLKAK